MKKRCYTCGKKKSLTEFSWSNKSKNLKNNRCKECQKELSHKHYLNNKENYLDSQRNSRERNKRFIFDYLKSKLCIDCGNDNPIVLDFDHTDPSKKLFNISDGVSDKYSIENIKLEIEKCEIRCRNCHQIKTAKEYNQYRYYMK